MDEILALQQQLAAAQLSTTSQRLSDRNCIELVMKLQSLNLIDLIFTRSGKEYLTPSHLVLEVQDELLTRAGRVNLIDLPDALNVALNHIEAAIPQVLQDESVRLVRGELITDYYLESLADEINDSLTASETGTDNLGAIATRYSLPVDVMRQAILAHEGKTISASYDPASGILRSAASIARDKAATRGLLRAMTTPTLLSDIAALRNLPQALVSEVAENMIRVGDLSGTVDGRGTRAVFIPATFAKAAVQAVTSAFRSNGFVTLDRLTRMRIPNVDQFVTNHLTGAFILSECVVGPILLDTLATSASEAISNGTWLDISRALPPDFPEIDVPDVVIRTCSSLSGVKSSSTGKAKSVDKGRPRGKRKPRTGALGKEAKQNGQVAAFGERFLVSAALIDMFNHRINTDAEQRASERAKTMTERMEFAVSHFETAKSVTDSETKETEKKVKGKGRRRGAPKDKKAENGGSNAAKSAEEQFLVTVPSEDEVANFILGDEECSKVLEADYLASSTEAEEMIARIVEELYPAEALHSLYHAKASEAVASLERVRALAQKNAEKALLEGLAHAELYNNAADTLPTDDLIQISRKFVVDEICLNILCRMVESIAQNTGVQHQGLSEARSLATSKQKVELLREAALKFAPTLEANIRSFIAIFSRTSNGTAQEFLKLYDDSISLFDLPERRPLEKKGEKASLAKLRCQLVASLDEYESLTKMMVLSVAAVLIHAKTCGGSLVMLPVEHTVSFCKEIEEGTKPVGAGEALRELRGAITAIENQDEDVDQTSLSQAFIEKLQGLREYTG